MSSTLPDKAMILAAGLGTRMMPLTADKPKPLVVLQGKTLIDHAIDRLKAGGIDTFVVNVHYKAEMLVAHLQKRRDVTIHICDETKEILDTGGAIKRALSYFDGKPFFTYNSDSLWVEGMGRSIARMRAHWDERTMDSLMLLAPTTSAVGYDGNGDFDMSPSGLLSRKREARVTPFVFTGLQIMHPRLLEGAPEVRFSINPYWNKAIEAKRLFGIRLDGVWLHVGTPQGLKDAETYLADLRQSA